MGTSAVVEACSCVSEAVEALEVIDDAAASDGCMIVASAAIAEGALSAREGLLEAGDAVEDGAVFGDLHVGFSKDR